MSSTVDNRVVEMGFNNKQFETGVAESSASLAKFKKSLDLTESAKGLNALNAAGKNVNFSSMGASLDHISSKFSAMGVIGFTVLQNLTNSAINFGKKLLSSLTAPIKQGLQEYETQINAVQTILANTASKGTTLEQVNDALDQLNEYSDKTIYNFTEMARNIGTFTAAGIGLETSVSAIKGIANLAAVSGSNSQQAATAMYQLSQALAGGTVRLMDWNSVVNAGMGGEVFQNALKETARVSGVAIDKIIEKNGTFRESLQEGWLTSEILIQTLAKFTGDLNREQLAALGYTEEQIDGIIKLGQTASDAATKVKTLSQLKGTIQEALVSGWAQTWRILVGDFEEARSLFTGISDTLSPMIQRSAEARNTVLQGWADMGGRARLIDAMYTAFNKLKTILSTIGEAFREVFPPVTAQGLYNLTLVIANLARSFLLTSERIKQIKRIFLGLFSAIAIVIDVVKFLVSAFFGLGKAIPSGTLSRILEFFAKIGDYFVALRAGTDVKSGLTAWVERLKEVIEEAKVIFDRAKTSVITFIDTIKSKFALFKEWFSSLFADTDISGIETFFENIKIKFAPFTILAKVASVVIGGLINLLKKLAPSLLKAGTAIAKFAAKIGVKIFEGIKNIKFDELLSNINSGLIAGVLVALRGFLKSGTGTVQQIGSLFSSTGGGLVGILNGVRTSLEAFQQNLKAKTLLTIAIAIGILAVSLIALSMVDPAKLAKALGVVTALFADMMISMRLLGGMGAGGLAASAGLVALSASLLIIAAAMKVIASMDQGDIDKALGSIYALTVTMIIFSKLMTKNTAGILSGSVSMIAFGLALLVIVQAIRQLGDIQPERLTNGLLAIGILMAEIAVFMKLVSGSKVSATSGLGLLGIAASILVLSLVIEKLGEMDVAQLQQGLIAIGAVLLSLGLFIKLAGNGKSMIATALGMTIIAGAMYLLVDVISELAKLSWEELGRGLAGMGGALLIIAAAVRAMPKNMILTSVGLIAVAFALTMLASALVTMSGMTWDEIGRGLAVLGGSLAIIAVGLYLMAGTIAGSIALIIAAGALAILVPVLTALGSMSLGEIGMALLALAGVFLVLGIAGMALTPVVPTLLGLGISIMLIGVAALLVGLGLVLFAAGLTALSVSAVAAATAIVAAIGIILGIIPMIINALVSAVKMFAQGIIDAAPLAFEAIGVLLDGFLNLIIEYSPKIFEALKVLLEDLIQLIVDVGPDFIAAVVLLLVTLIQEIAKKLPDFLAAGFDILIEFLKGIRDNIGEVVTVVGEIIVEFLGAVGDSLPDVIQAGWDLMLDFINGLSQSVDDNMEVIMAAMGRLAANLITGLVKGIAAGAGQVAAAIVGLIKGGEDAGNEQAEADSPSKVFMRMGKTFPEGMALGIKKNAYLVNNAMKKVIDASVKGVDTLSGSLAEAINSNFDLNPVIRPVVDMSDIVKSGEKINDTFGQIDLMPSLEAADRVSRNMFKYSSQPDSTVSTTSETIGKITMIQNNYSPKALSPIDIYRQTQQQLRTLKGLI